MELQSWSSPYSPGSPSPAEVPPPPPRTLGYELRPLSIGEVLDRIFSLYRGHFWLLAGLSSVSAGVNVSISILRLIYMHFASITIASPSYSTLIAVATLVQLTFYIIAYSLTLAATTSAVNALYLGQPTSIAIALTAARRLWLRCLGIAIWQAWSACWIFVVLVIPIAFIPGARSGAAIALGIFLGFGMIAGCVYGVIAYLRNSLAVPAAVVEGLPIRAAMRRSKRLATGRIGRIFLLFLLVYALWLTAGVIQVPFALLAVSARAAQQFAMQGVVLAINFITTTVVGPIMAIGLCLFYFDERVRREGFDIEVLLQNAALASPEPAAPPAPEPLAAPDPAPEQI